MKESKFVNIFIDEMKKKFPTMYYRKIHGDAYQKDIADNLFCINGLFLAIEFKVQRDGRIHVTPMQLKELNDIKNAKGISLIIAINEDNGKILVREGRIDYKAIFLNSSNTSVKSKNIKIDWDFEFSRYEDIMAVLGVLIENKGGL